MMYKYFVLLAIAAFIMGIVFNKEMLLYFIWSNTFIALAYLSAIYERRK